jgi:hypothetical protein
MLGEAKMLNDTKNSIISAILVHGANNGLKSAGHHLCRYSGAFIAKDTGSDAEAIATLSEIVVAEHVIAQRIPVARVEQIA